MGANQSLPNEKQKLVIERLQAMQIEESDCRDDSDYLLVDEKDGDKTPFRAPWKSLSVPEMGKWEHELLADPKNR